MSSISEIKKTRIKKLDNIKQAGINPYPAKANRTHKLNEAVDNFDELSKTQKEIVVVGRLRAIRSHGSSAFCHVQDESGQLQLYFKKDELNEKYKFFVDNFDIGDFIEAKGSLFLTKKGEKTLLVGDYRILAKSLAPLPEKWHGLKNVEERFRKRYLDILFNDQVRQMIVKKAVFWNSMRSFLIDRGFLEVETPILESKAGGANAKPFITHHNALDMEVSLRISMGELWQKKLMVAGFEKTFEIGRQFRNEGMSDEHLQEYTQMEFYWAYADYRDGMKLVEQMFKHVAQKTFNTLKFKIKGRDVDLSKKWEVYDYLELIKQKTGIDVLKTDLKQIEAKLKELKVKYDKKGFNLTRGIDNLWKYCRGDIVGPGFLINIPVSMEPLAKRSSKNPEVVERFQVRLAGSEMGKGYSELNDPLDQAERLKKQQQFRDQGDDEAQVYDQDFVEALEYGMPPTCGFGVSERLFSFLMDKPVRECQIFPLMKPKDLNQKSKVKN